MNYLIPFSLDAGSDPLKPGSTGLVVAFLPVAVQALSKQVKHK